MKTNTPDVIQQELERICRAAECGMKMVEDGNGKQLDRIARDIIFIAKVVKDMAYELSVKSTCRVPGHRCVTDCLGDSNG